jgi:hypothetical protein
MAFYNGAGGGAAMDPETYARRRLLLAQRAGLFRGQIPAGDAASVWRNFSSNLSSDAQSHGYANPLAFLQDSARMGSPQTYQPDAFDRAAGQGPDPAPAPATSPLAEQFNPGQNMGGGMPHFPTMGAAQGTNPYQSHPMQQFLENLRGVMAVEHPEIKQMLASALATLNARFGGIAQQAPPMETPRYTGSY